MDIRFISSLTPEDEDAVAPVLLKAVAALLDNLPITYIIRIETTGAQVRQHSHTPSPSSGKLMGAGDDAVPAAN